MKKLANKVALVTGGSRGIGAAIVRKLAADGASVAFTLEQLHAFCSIPLCCFVESRVVHRDGGLRGDAGFKFKAGNFVWGIGLLADRLDNFRTGTIEQRTTDEQCVASLDEENEDADGNRCAGEGEFGFAS